MKFTEVFERAKAECGLSPPSACAFAFGTLSGCIEAEQPDGALVYCNNQLHRCVCAQHSAAEAFRVDAHASATG